MHKQVVLTIEHHCINLTSLIFPTVSDNVDYNSLTADLY